ncbi:MAG TPA: hypothetical protein VNT25_01085 [Allosphingosinicella sp.]|nr:hypothetical protein [Allosphingosinicella sp.]
MIAKGFKPVGWVAAVASAALGCYMLSLNVASERAELAAIERQIMMTKRDIRLLQTELGTRGRLAQLDRWNAEVLALSAPASGQFLQSEFTLASFATQEKTIDQRAEVRMAAADSPAAAQPAPKAAVAKSFEPEAPVQPSLERPMVRQASLVVAPSSALAKVKPVVIDPAAAPKAAPKKSSTTKLASVQSAVAKPAKAVKKVGLIDDELAREIIETSKTEKVSGGASTR